MRLAAFVLSTFAVAGCQTGEFIDWSMQNATDDVVYVFWFDDGEEERMGPIQPDTNGHLPVQYPEECSSGILIARTSAGREIARRTEPLCRNDTWVITDATK